MISTLQKNSILALCEEVAQPGQLQVFMPETIIVSPGEVGDFVCVIKSGILKLALEYGKTPLTIDFLCSGYITGLINLNQSINYPCYISTLTESSAYVWEREKILELMKIMPEFSIEFQKNYSNWGLRVVERLKSLVFLAPHQRVASWVYDYGKYEFYKRNKVWSRVSVKDMAEFCNVSIIDFNTAINELIRNEVIVLSKTGILVKNWEKLSYIINP